MQLLEIFSVSTSVNELGDAFTFVGVSTFSSLNWNEHSPVKFKTQFLVMIWWYHCVMNLIKTINPAKQSCHFNYKFLHNNSSCYTQQKVGRLLSILTSHFTLKPPLSVFALLHVTCVEFSIKYSITILFWLIDGWSKRQDDNVFSLIVLILSPDVDCLASSAGRF